MSKNRLVSNHFSRLDIHKNGKQVQVFRQHTVYLTKQELQDKQEQHRVNLELLKAKYGALEVVESGK